MPWCDECGRLMATVELLKLEVDAQVGYVGYQHVMDVCQPCGEAAVQRYDQPPLFLLGEAL